MTVISMARLCVLVLHTEHGLIGTVGHTVASVVSVALFYDNNMQMSDPEVLIKFKFPLQNYFIFMEIFKIRATFT